MKVQEIMERSGVNQTGLAVALVKDAIHLIQSQSNDYTATWKTNISDVFRFFFQNVKVF